MLIFLAFIALSCGTYTFVEPSTVRLGQTWQYWMHISQYYVNEQRLAAAGFYNQNYTFVNIGTGCGTPTLTQPEVVGKLLLITVAERDSKCTMQSVAENYNPLQPAGYMIISFFGAQRGWGGYNTYAQPSNDIPIMYTGADMTLNFALMGSPSSGLTAANATINLGYPDQNPWFLENYSGLVVRASIYCALCVSIFTMCLAVFKFSQFLLVEKKIQFSIPQMCLFFVFMSSLFFLITDGFLGGGQNAQVTWDATEGMYHITPGFTFTALIILSFYFGEVAQLTSAPTSAGLSVMKIPAAIFILVTWAFVFAAGAIDADDVLSVETTASSADLFLFFFAWMGVVVPFYVSCVFIWGVVSLLKAMSGSPQAGPILRIVALAVLVICLLWGVCIFAYLLYYFPGDLYDQAAGYYGQYDPWPITGISLFSWLVFFRTFGYMTINVAICLVFQVSVAKEIELSKSGTSSTSGSSGSSGSSSSSSSSDPVIEL